MRGRFLTRMMGIALGLWITIVSGTVMAYTYWSDAVVDTPVRVASVERTWDVEDSVPTRVEIDALGIDTDVLPGMVVDGQWELSDSSANYLIGSGLVGERGNVVIYAHKRDGLFKGLSKIEVGSEITIASRDVMSVYEVTEAFETTADNVSVLDPSIVPELTLYTCNRWNDSHRFVVKARLVKKWSSGLGGLAIQSAE